MGLHFVVYVIKTNIEKVGEMAKRFADTDKYKKKFIRELPAPYKILWEYICLDCNHAGIWQVDFEVAQIRVGKDAPINEKEALALFNKDEERIIVINSGSKWFIKPFVEFQYNELLPNNRVHISVLDELKKYKIKGYASPLQRGKDKDKDKDMDKDKEKNKDIDFINSLKNNPAYKHIDIDTELAKMDAWLSTRPARKKTRRFVVNWLNKIDKPIGTIKTEREKKAKPDCYICKGTGKIPDGELKGAICNCVK